MRLVSFRLCSALLLTLVAGVGLVWGQAGTAALYGEVTDPQGGAIVGAKVTLTQATTGTTRTEETDTAGRYHFYALAPGAYRLRVEMAGFRTAVRENLELAVNITTKFNIRMELGAVTETVVVTEAAVALNTTDASLGFVLTLSQINSMPLEARDAAGLLSLQPGAVFVPTANSNTGVDSRSGAINGARSDQTNITLDGVDNNDPQFGFAFTGALRATLDSIQEFRVTTTNYNADQGRSSSAQISMVTRSGTNEIHGSAYYAHRNEALSANEWFLNASDQSRRKLRKHVAGGRLGGPLIKNRLFLFGNYEDRLDKREETALRDVPSWHMRNGYLIYPCATPSDTRCAGGTVTIAGRPVDVPAGSYLITPAQLAAIDPLGIGPSTPTLDWFRRYPEANDPAAGFDGVNIHGFRFAAPIDNRFKTFVTRLDWNIDQDAQHQLFVRANLQDDRQARAPQFPGQDPNSTRLDDAWGFAVGYKALLSPNLVNNLRWGFVRLKDGTIGLQTGSYLNFRFLNDLEGFGTNTLGRTLPSHHLVNDTVWTRGKHTLSFGGTYRYTRNARFSNANSFHFFTSNPSWVEGEGASIRPGSGTCDGTARPGCTAVPAVDEGFGASYHDAAINLYAMITQATAFYNFTSGGSTLAEGDAVRRKFRTNEYEFYFQDQWSLHPTLTLTFGLRYILISPPWEADGEQVIPRPNLGEWFETRRSLMEAGIPASQAPDIVFDLGGPANDAPHYYRWDYNNFSPRLAAAWSPRFTDGFLGKLLGNGKTVLRAGYAIVYDRIGNGLTTQFDDLGSFGLSTSIDSTFGACDEGLAATGESTLPACPRFNGNIFSVPTSFLPPSPGASFPSTPPDGNSPGGFAITSALDSDILTPYAHTINVSLGRELPWGMVVEGSYVGRRGRKALVQRDLAMPLDLVDPISGMTYFEAATLLVQQIEQGVPVTSVQNIPYWENMYPNWGAVGMRGLTNTQEAYRRFNIASPDYTFALFRMDFACPDPGRRIPCSRFGQFAYFDDQFAALSAWSTVGRSEYHAFQLAVRKRFTHGLSFDMNYTLSKSRDHGSEAEYADSYGGLGTGGVTGFLVNSWEPDRYYAYSDFDMRHQLNANWSWELPFGRGRRFGGNAIGAVNQIIGGWEFSGLLRTTSGLPATVGNGRFWPTNWNITGNATCISSCPSTQTTKNATFESGETGPSIFADPAAAFNEFRFSRPGETGDRNIIRGDGYYSWDIAIGKRFWLPWEGHVFRMRWEVFNLTNTVRFDTGSLNMNLGASGSFGKYNDVLGPRDGAARVMQFSFRYEF